MCPSQRNVNKPQARLWGTLARRLSWAHGGGNCVLGMCYYTLLFILILLEASKNLSSDITALIPSNSAWKDLSIPHIDDDLPSVPICDVGRKKKRLLIYVLISISLIKGEHFFLCLIAIYFSYLYSLLKKKKKTSIQREFMYPVQINSELLRAGCRNWLAEPMPLLH